MSLTRYLVERCWYFWNAFWKFFMTAQEMLMVEWPQYPGVPGSGRTEAQSPPCPASSDSGFYVLHYPTRPVSYLSFLPCGGCPHLFLCPDPLILPALSCFPCRLPVPPALQKVDLICFDVKVLRRSRLLTWLPARECPPWSGRPVSEHTPFIHLARSALWAGDRPEWNRFSSSFCLIRVVGAQLKS